ncbi:rRNA methyltransferase [Saccharothrix sp. NRRL B-16348]|uniref:TrmH family RNA methyltransferase n=1 Tax=Saccharothrix sp. NRRL B-16348 TaxID=1415542 RepID=UPI0006ADF073|nr:RNA methyltransferase [Saccharothrix sp. NRRL B-16348]KOX22619.1 rRNA methyltransferase [Saccharothrix sp. NRRL B-16348]
MIYEEGSSVDKWDTARVIEIDDPADPRLDDFRDLSTADRRPDRPGGRGLVIAEGVVVVERLLDSPYPVRGLLGVRRRVEALGDLPAPAYVTSAEVMAEVVGFHLNRGVLAAADRAPQPDVADLVASSRRLAVLEGVGDHENLGSLFRNAAALGIDGVLLGPGCSDPLYRRSVRVSMGHVLRVPFASMPNLTEGFELLRRNGFTVAALTPRAGSENLADAGLRGRKVAVLLGSEGPGLTEETIAAADLAVRIPMAEGVDSLNVATAAAIAFYAIA